MVHQNRTVEDCKNVAWSDESLPTTMLMVGKQYKSKDPSCRASTHQTVDGVMVLGIFSWHTLVPLVPTDHCLSATLCLSMGADHIFPFKTTVYPPCVQLTNLQQMCDAVMSTWIKF